MEFDHQNEHFVQFYHDEDLLLDDLREFTGGGINKGDTCIVIATPAHRRALDLLLTGDGLDIRTLAGSHQYQSYDAQATLDRFMEGGLPHKAKFNQIMEGLLPRTGSHQTRAFGEMVALLWKQGNQAAAILLEQLWNDAVREHDLTLFCAYPMHHFEHQAHENMLEELRQLHSFSLFPESALKTE